MELELKDKVALVTGAGGFIGRCICRTLAEAGATVAVGDVNLETAGETVRLITEAGGRAKAYEMNVRQVESIESVVASVIDQLGKIDVLVNVAGGSARGRASLFHESDESVIREIIEINLYGTLFTCRAVLGHMIERGSGRIVNIGSVLASRAHAKIAEYCAAKGGVVALTRALALEVAHHNIFVNCVSPGRVPRPEEDKTNIPNTNYLQRCAPPESVANLVLFLASEKADFIIGQDYTVDGGWGLGVKHR